LHVYCTYSYNDDWLWSYGSDIALYVSISDGQIQIMI